MRVAMLYSGGKDSNLSLWRLHRRGDQIVCLLSVISERDDSYMFHIPNVELTAYQAECLNLPRETIYVSGIKEAEVDELGVALLDLKEKYGIEGMGTGAIASKYQKARIDSLCCRLGIESIAPLWGEDEDFMLREMLGLGFEVYFTSVSAEGLGRDWLGSRLDEERVLSLLRLKEKYGINASGEGGEYETFVSDMPLFWRRIEVLESEVKWAHNSGTWMIKKARIICK